MEGFTVSLALVDAIPVLSFGISNENQTLLKFLHLLGDFQAHN